jgi:hypothetical protein
LYAEPEGERNDAIESQPEEVVAYRLGASEPVPLHCRV